MLGPLVNMQIKLAIESVIRKRQTPLNSGSSAFPGKAG